MRLPRRKSNTVIAGIAGVNATRTRGAVNFTLGHARDGKRKIHVEDAFVLSKVTTDMPMNLVDTLGKWKHLAGLELEDSNDGTPARVDILLGADYFGEVLLRGRRWGPRGHALCPEDVLWLGFSRTTPNEESPTNSVHLLRLYGRRPAKKVLGDRGL